jgi:hypothetical protein
MALTKLIFKPGVNKEITNTSNKGGWVSSDKVRFRQGFPEKIGGWQRISVNTFLGTCRTLWEWATLGGTQLLGVGTNLKYYVERGGIYYDITPIRATTAPGGVTFAATNGSNVITVTDTAHGAIPNDFVTFSGAASLGGAVTATVLNREYQILTTPTANTYTIRVAVTANASDTGNGGASVVGAYQLNTGAATAQAISGWGAGPWGNGTWGNGATSITAIRMWSHSNYGEDLIYGPRGDGLYYWDASGGVGTRGVLVTGSDVPTVHNSLLVSDVSRFVLVFGCNELGTSTLDPMLVRWSDQEDYTNWTPAITNQAGGLRLSTGSKIVTAKQNRQEILVWTDTALYSMQYQGPPFVWGAQLMGENVSIAGTQAVALANNTAYWMGADKFYRYDGRVQTMRCDLRRFVFSRFDAARGEEVVCGTNEGFNEVWWVYPRKNQSLVNDYVVYNYAEDIWYYGTLERTAWLDSAFRGNPITAWQDRIVQQETGVDDLSTDVPQPIEAFIESADADLGDGEKAAFAWRIIPDLTFENSDATNPAVLLTLKPRAAPGGNYRGSVGGEDDAQVVRSTTVPVEQFTEQVNIRVRGRQVAMRIESSALGVSWQLGTPRVDLRPDGRRG